MTKGKNDKPNYTVILDPNPKGELKPVTGAEHDDWSLRLMNLVANALPDQRNGETANKAIHGMLDMKPNDPIEGMLISKIVVVSEAALSLYRLAWAQPRGYFEARLKYLAHADKASRTMAMLIERLDQHRGRGQQQITVKHVTVNADQAVVTDQIVGGEGKEALSNTLLTAGTDKPMEMVEPRSAVALPVEGGGSKAK